MSNLSNLNFVLTTEHPSSSQGIPVLVDQSTGSAYGPHDTMPWGEFAAQFVLRLWGNEAVPDNAALKFLWAAGLLGRRRSRPRLGRAFPGRQDRPGLLQRRAEPPRPAGAP